jgi:hypothetical protein
MLCGPRYSLLSSWHPPFSASPQLLWIQSRAETRPPRVKFAIACSLRNTGSAPINAPTFTNPAHWRHRAQEARWLAQQLEDPEAKAAKLEMAGKYDRLAARATEWMSKTEKIPQFLMSGDDDGQEEVINTRQPN